MAWDKIAERINGANVRIDGIECNLEVVTHPDGTYSATVNAHPTPRGKRTDAYRNEKRELRDDWSFCFEGEMPDEVWAQLTKNIPELLQP